MAKNDIFNIRPQAKKEPKTLDLDSIANIMEDILHDMKTHIEKTSRKSKQSVQNVASKHTLKLKEIICKDQPVKEKPTANISGDNNTAKDKKAEGSAVKKVVKEDTKSKDKNSNKPNIPKNKPANSRAPISISKSANISTNRPISRSNIYRPHIITKIMSQMQRPKVQLTKIYDRSRNVFSAPQSNNQNRSIRSKSVNNATIPKPNIMAQSSKSIANKRNISPPRLGNDIKPNDKKVQNPNSTLRAVPNEGKREQQVNKINESNKNNKPNGKENEYTKQKFIPKKTSYLTNIRQLVRNDNVKNQMWNKRAITSNNNRNDQMSQRSNSSRVQNKRVPPPKFVQNKSNYNKPPIKPIANRIKEKPKVDNKLNQNDNKTTSTPHSIKSNVTQNKDTALNKATVENTLFKPKDNKIEQNKSIVVDQNDIIKSIIQTNRITNNKPKVEQMQFLQELLPQNRKQTPQSQTGQKGFNSDDKANEFKILKLGEDLLTCESILDPKQPNTNEEIVKQQEKIMEIAKNSTVINREKAIAYAKSLGHRDTKVESEKLMKDIHEREQKNKDDERTMNKCTRTPFKSQSAGSANPYIKKIESAIKSAPLPAARSLQPSILKKLSEIPKKFQNKPSPVIPKESIKYDDSKKEESKQSDSKKEESKKEENKKEESKKDIIIINDSRFAPADVQMKNVENKINDYQKGIFNKSLPLQKLVLKPLTQNFNNIPTHLHIKPVIKTNIYPTVSKIKVSELPVNHSQPMGTIISSKFISPMEVIKDLVDKVNRAKRERKTFTVCGNFYSIRRAFAERGWVEKVRINIMNDRDNWKKLEGLTNIELVEGIRDKDHGDKYRRVLLSKLLAGHQVDFYWDYTTNPFIVNSDKIKRTLINRFPNGATRSYTTKPGLCETLKEATWAYIEGFSNVVSPRTYNLHGDNERRSFIEDFRITACVSLLKWVNYKYNCDTNNTIMSAEGKISISVYNFAVLQCQNIIKCQCHKDIDTKIPEAKESEWDTFLDRFYKIIHQNQHFLLAENMFVEAMVEQTRFILEKLREYLPYILMDGMMNLWLLKPHYGSRGCGILVCRTLRYMIETVHTRADIKYVAQKYIERPLLIHDTKFDIRQWFLVTSIPTLKIWMYKECYLRFSSQKFNLNRLDESVHLTNNSVQSRYKNCERNNKLPEDNMWHSDEFRRYLIESGYPFAWRNVIYKGMKETLIGLFMLCQDKLITRVNSFELCGADFMIDENFQPYLIEINSRPALGPTTKITARMCPKVLEDVVKVTVDNARNPTSSTGNFELILKDTWNFKVAKPPDLCVEGISYGQKEHEKPKLPTFKKEVIDKANTIETVLKIDPFTVKKEPVKTLKQILGVISKTKNNINIESQTEKNRLFKCLMSEYVEIISSNTSSVDSR